MQTSPSLADAHKPPGISPRLWVFYHYLYPDTVVSAIHMDQLCQGLHDLGWTVTGFSGNRGCRDENITYPAEETHQGVHIRRLWRPRFRQASSLGRLLNAAWMIAAWSLLAFDSEPPDAIVIGTDPILSVLTAICWKLLSPQTRIVHWCFDLYPEAAYADGLLSPGGWLARLLAPRLKRAYADCDALVDIGPCMRERLAHYASPARVETIVPWALEEPAAPLLPSVSERQEISGDTELSMVYSGTFGRAHDYEELLALAHALRGESAAMTFSVRGNRESELRAAVADLKQSDVCSIRFVPFAPAERLLDRLAAPDVHLLSLAPNWTGLVVPSKFFGALAVGRPVVFSGSADSSIAQWIMQYQLGWVLTPENVSEVATDLVEYVRSPQRVAAMQQRCFETYHQQFSRTSSVAHMHRLLAELTSFAK
jgi:hypothetical protein